jgi:serine/threonine protein kinase/Flp pilus assembly protein TadD
MNDGPNRDVSVFTEAVQLPLAERAAFLMRACGDDRKLRERVEALLRDHERIGDFLEEPAPEAVRGLKPIVSIGEKPGERVGRYKLLQQIGEGGCGVVFMAEQEEPVRRRVALKIIKPGMDTKSVVARFEAERQALALMDHPNIAKVLDAGATESGRPYFVMELVRGVKITEYCDRNSLTTEERLKLLVQVCHAVQHAHQKGVIHRDLKPSNILVTTTLEGAALPVVIDFGIAKATTNQRLTDKTLFTAFEMLIGTPAYMSPEQAALASADVDTRTDIYSLGVLLYELLTGSPPFDARELLKAGLDEVRKVIREKEAQRPSTKLSRMTNADLTTVAQYRKSDPPKLIRSISGDLDWIVMKALEKDRTRRYATANGLALDVQRFLANETILARPPGALYKFQKTVLRNKLLFACIGVVGAVLIVGLIVVSASFARERRAHIESDAGKRKVEIEAAKSKQVTQFLEEMLQGVGPSVARGRDKVMLREILDRTADRVGVGMTNQPEVEAELCGLIGQLYREIGVFDRSEEMHRKALAINEKLFGRESLAVAESLSGLSLALFKQGIIAESERAQDESLAIRRRLLGNDSATVAGSLNNLATIYRHQHRFAEAERLIRESLGIRQKLFGKESSAVADSLHNLSCILIDEGRTAEGETTARELLALRERLSGREDPSVAAALADVGWAATRSGKLDEAMSSDQKALAMRQKLLGDDHPDVAKTLAELGELMAQRGKLAEGHAVLAAAISIQRKILGEDNPDTLDSLDFLGWLLECEGKLAEAETVHRHAMTLWRAKAGNEYPQALSELAGLVRTLTAQKKFADAEQVLNEALTPAFIQKPESADLLAQRVDLLGRQGRWQEAATSATLVVRQQTDHYRFHTLAGLLAITRDHSAYEQICRRSLTTFAGTTNPYVAERMATDCLLLPNSGADLASVDKLADTAVALGPYPDLLPYSQACKAISLYRLGQFAEAVAWANKTKSEPYAQAKACAVQAMAHWRLGQEDEARAALARGNSMARPISPTDTTPDLGAAWLAWVFARVSLDEAEMLMQPGAATARSPGTPR